MNAGIIQFIKNNFDLIIDICKILFGALLTATPMVIAFIKAAKCKKNAEDTTTKAIALSAMREQASAFIQLAEQTYKSVDEMMKQRGQSAGPLKKDTVMTKLQSFAIENGYAFDSEFWSAEIDNLVTLTKKVNTK